MKRSSTERRPSLGQNFDEVVNRESRRAISEHHVNREQYGVIRQGDAICTIMMTVEATSRGEGVGHKNRGALGGVA